MRNYLAQEGYDFFYAFVEAEGRGADQAVIVVHIAPGSSGDVFIAGASAAVHVGDLLDGLVLADVLGLTDAPHLEVPVGVEEEMQGVRVVLQIIVRAAAGDDAVALLHKLDDELALLAEDIVGVLVLGPGKHREDLVEDVLLFELGLLGRGDEGFGDQELVGDMGDQFLVIELIVHALGDPAAHLVSAAAVFAADGDDVFHGGLLPQ